MFPWSCLLLVSPWPTFGCSARRFQMGTCGTNCVCAVGEVKLEMTGFAFPWGRTKRWWSTLEEGVRFNFKVLQTLMNYALSSPPTPPLFFVLAKTFSKGLETVYVRLESFWNLAANYCSPCTCLLRFLSTSREESMLTIVQLKIRQQIFFDNYKC